MVWGTLQAVDDVVGPELSFAKAVSQAIKAPIALIKGAAGGTTLVGDWNPDAPSDFELYPLSLQLIQSSLAARSKPGLTQKEAESIFPS